MIHDTRLASQGISTWYRKLESEAKLWGLLLIAVGLEATWHPVGSYE